MEHAAKKRKLEETDYANDSTFQKLVDTLMKRKPYDVYFIVQGAYMEVVPAYKAILAASSPVFERELREKDDFKVRDVSPAAFKAFLQLFYKQRVMLTMRNIAVVLRLVDTYKVAGGFPICVDFLKDHLLLEDILWGLDLAFMYKLDDLKAFCTSEIRKNFQKVWNMIEVKDDGKLSLLPKPESNNRIISEDNSERICQHVCEIIPPSLIASLFTENDKLRERSTFSFNLMQSFEEIDANEVIQFSLSQSMQLTDIICPRLYKAWPNWYTGSSKMTITRNSEELVSTKIVWGNGEDGEGCVILKDPIKIEKDCTHSIIVEAPIDRKISFKTNEVIIPQKPVLLTSLVQISFPKLNGKEYTRSLISRLHFEPVH